MTSFFILIPTLLLFGWAAWSYNRLVDIRNQQLGAWSGVELQLKKRSDLVPPLVECVSAYRLHESAIFRETSDTRSQADLVREIRGLVAVAEGYPDLKAGENFRALMGRLVTIEDELQHARRYYNGLVRDFRNLTESFPSNLIAGVFGFQPGEFFEVETVLERSDPKVKL